ncbi:MAG: prolipoprotein diacylglyceryl transferase [Planctomycetes bacterium]|nr:prolipoprotein diacylglyceryl transferase [Planctomycetota bacterium]
MYPELFELPFLHITVKSYGFMMVVGFVFAIILMRKMARRIGENPENAINAALYVLVIGVVGARIFYVIHNFKGQYADNPLSVFAVWNGGLELLGGVILAIVFILVYLHFKKLSIRRYLDMLCTGLMMGLAFGRIGCLLNGCCFGAPTDHACAIRFPYASPSYNSQAFPNHDRGRTEPQLSVPTEYYDYYNANGDWISAPDSNKYYSLLKPFGTLTEQQKYEVKYGKYRALKVHPMQLYSSANALLLCGVLYCIWRKAALTKPGFTLASMFVLYGITRIFLEVFRDDNPFEYAWWIIYKGGTISQNIGVYMIIIGTIMFFSFAKFAKKMPVNVAKTRKNASK